MPARQPPGSAAGGPEAPGADGAGVGGAGGGARRSGPPQDRPAARVPGVALRLLGLSLLARAPQGMAPLSVILLVQERTGSLAAAGAASGAWALGIAVGQPLWARPAGRGRAERVIAAVALVQALLLLVLALAPWSAAALAVGLALLGGLCQAPVTPVARSLWPELTSTPAATDRMFTLDATVQEVIWIAGPAVVGVLVAVAGPVPSLVVTAVLGGLGGVVFALAVRPLWTPHPAHHARERFLELLLVPYLGLCAMAFGLGLGEVGVPAAAILDGRRDAAGWLLAVWSCGSLVGGLVAARRASAADPVRRIPWLLLALTCGGLATAAVWTLGLGWLGVVLFLTGLGLAPTLAAAYGVVSRTAPPRQRTEAFALGTTFILVGLALGSAVGGVLSDITPTLAFVGGAVAYLVAAVLWLAFGARTRQRARRTRDSSQTGSSDS